MRDCCVLKPYLENIYKIHYPDHQDVPLLLDSPHSGRIYPDDFNYDCAFSLLEKSEDNHLDTLFSNAPDHGATLLCALFPRTYIDVNRAIDDIEHELVADGWPGILNPTARAHAGIGLIRRIAKPGIPVYKKPLYASDIKRRIEDYYLPYHDALKTLSDRIKYNFGQVWHVNCHSMPSQRYHLRRNAVKTYRPIGMFQQMPDFVLGDRDGTSCMRDFTQSLSHYLRSRGFKVAINDPYRGVELVKRHGQPAIGRHSLQLEINKALYWDEDALAPSENFEDFKAEIERLVSFLRDYVSAQSTSMAAD